MSESDEKLSNLAKVAVLATAGAGLDAPHWSDPETRERVLKVLAYTQLMVEGSDASLVSSVVGSELEAPLSEFVNAPEQLALESGPRFGAVERRVDEAQTRMVTLAES